ncbi:MAG: type II toxin-antitoxin system Phd/YefM family antitoxin [Acetobacteraceae bacterium]
MSDWQLQEVKNRFSEVVRRAADEGPQTVTVHGKPAAVVVSAETYARLTRPRKTLAEFLLEGPPWPDDLVEAINDRSRDTGRDVEF